MNQHHRRDCEGISRKGKTKVQRNREKRDKAAQQAAGPQKPITRPGWRRQPTAVIHHLF
jgi:hypothetical protein